MFIAHNMMAMNAQRQLNINFKSKAKSTEKLSSGYRINRAADDAAGLAISEKMRRQIRGLTQASANCQDGVALCQVADGALVEMDSILDRMTELSVKAANGTNTPEDRQIIDEEMQQLKLALKDISNNTNFNEKYIFRQPYVPDIKGTQNDTKIFMDSTGSFGGLAINNIRYNWNELGVKINPDGTFVGQNIRFHTWDGELVDLETKRGGLVPDISRIYHWKAEGDGIYVNDKLACTWENMGLDVNNIELKEYNFQYRDMDISFSVTEPETKMSDLLAGINGNGMNNISWQTVISAQSPEKAVDILSPDGTGGSYSQKLLITEANKNWINDSANPYNIVATDQGVTLETNAGCADNNTHTFTSWNQFSNVNTGESGYPIVDWGLANGTANAGDISLDDTANYQYKDNQLGIQFQFKLADEASLEGTKNGMNVAITQNSLLAPLEATASDGYGDINATVNFEFALQKALNRYFDSNNTVVGDYSINMTRTQIPYNYGGYLYQFSFGVTVGSTIFSAQTGWRQSELPSGKYRLTSPDYKNSYIEIDTSAFRRYSNRKIQVTAKDYAYQNLSADENYNGNSSTKTTFNLQMNAPKKVLTIQAGAEAGQHLDITWDAVNMTTMGLASTNTRTAADSGAAIEQVKNAKHFVSKVRSDFGAYQNRLEHTIKNLDNVVENTTEAESSIRDTDMAKEMVKLSTQNILEQAGFSVMSQANQSNQGVVSLLS